MKFPPLTGMEPLPPVPSCSRDLAPDGDIDSVAERVEEGGFISEGGSEVGDFEDESDAEGEEGEEMAGGREDRRTATEPGIEPDVSIASYAVYLVKLLY